MIQWQLLSMPNALKQLPPLVHCAALQVLDVLDESGLLRQTHTEHCLELVMLWNTSLNRLLTG